MRVVIPTTRYRPEVSQALAESGWPWARVDVSHADDAYWNLLYVLWSRSETFCIVEHDIIVRPETLTEIAACGSDWCGVLCDYVGLEEGYAGLGCTKFSADLIGRNPEAVQRAASYSDSQHPPKHWCRLDAWLQGALRGNGEEMCVHGPALEHVRDYDGKVMPSHGCWK